MNASYTSLCTNHVGNPGGVIENMELLSALEWLLNSEVSESDVHDNTNFDLSQYWEF